MDSKKKEQLAAKGWIATSVQEFLELAPEEMAYIELKLQLSAALRKRRQEKQITQAELAELLNSSQSRIAKMEKGDPSVSIDLLVRSLFALEVTKEELARVISITALA
jgi:DNA-binding XRE family transcriptional regulator